MIRVLALLLILSPPSWAGDFYNTITNDLQCSKSSPGYTTPAAIAAGWKSVDRTLFPGPPQDWPDWVYESGTNTFRVRTSGENTTAEDARALYVRANALIDRALLQYLRDNVSVSPPAWAVAAVITEAEALLDARIAVVDAKGTTP